MNTLDPWRRLVSAPLTPETKSEDSPALCSGAASEHEDDSSGLCPASEHEDEDEDEDSSVLRPPSSDL